MSSFVASTGTYLHVQRKVILPKKETGPDMRNMKRVIYDKVKKGNHESILLAQMLITPASNYRVMDTPPIRNTIQERQIKVLECTHEVKQLLSNTLSVTFDSDIDPDRITIFRKKILQLTYRCLGASTEIPLRTESTQVTSIDGLAIQARQRTLQSKIRYTLTTMEDIQRIDATFMQLLEYNIDTFLKEAQGILESAVMRNLLPPLNLSRFLHNLSTYEFKQMRKAFVDLGLPDPFNGNRCVLTLTRMELWRTFWGPTFQDALTGTE